MVEKLSVPVSITRLDNHEFLYVNPKGFEIFGLDYKINDFNEKKASDYFFDPEERISLVDELKSKGIEIEEGNINLPLCLEIVSWISHKYGT